MADTTSYNLLAIPVDVKKIIMREQNALKMEKSKVILSMETTIYHIIRDWDKLQKTKK